VRSTAIAAAAIDAGAAAGRGRSASAVGTAPTRFGLYQLPRTKGRTLSSSSARTADIVFSGNNLSGRHT